MGPLAGAPLRRQRVVDGGAEGVNAMASRVAQRARDLPIWPIPWHRPGPAFRTCRHPSAPPARDAPGGLLRGFINAAVGTLAWGGAFEAIADRARSIASG